MSSNFGSNHKQQPRPFNFNSILNKNKKFNDYEASSTSSVAIENNYSSSHYQRSTSPSPSSNVIHQNQQRLEQHPQGTWVHPAILRRSERRRGRG